MYARNTFQKIFIVFAVYLMFSSMVLGFIPSQSVSAASWRAGRIIDDSKFTNSSAMSTSQIQSFLNSRNSACLKNYQTQSIQGSNNYGSNVSAATAIKQAANLYGINPQVLLVTLQKENGLVTRSDCPSWRYRTAMGFGCPDSAPCDSQWYGLSKQLYQGARHLRGYYDQNSGWYIPFKPGNRYVQWHPNGSCGGKTINIENRATASLYSYTPYQPNSAAMNAGFGTGNACSSYGNRNFWLYYNAWFGTSVGGYLVRTNNNATVYFLSGNTKYPIADVSLLGELSPFGPLTYVSDTYINSHTTGGTMGRVIKTEDGTVWLYNSGIKLAFTSCALVEDYGYTCDGAIDVTDIQANLLSTGPNMTNRYTIASTQESFLIADGKKHQGFDQASFTADGHTATANWLSAAGINHLAYGSPIARDDVYINASSGKKYFFTNDTYYELPSGLGSSLFKNIEKSSLAQSGIDQATRSSGFQGFLKRQGAEQYYILDANGLASVSTPSQLSATYLTLPSSTLNKFGSSGKTLSTPFLSDNSGTVYYVAAAKKYPIPGWGDYLALAGSPADPIFAVATHYTNALSSEHLMLGPGSLVKYANNGTVYAIDGLDKKIPLATFTPATELGMSGGLRTIAASTLDAYTTTSPNLSFKIECNSENLVGIGGKVYEFASGAAAEYEFTGFRELDARTCEVLQNASASLGRYIRTPDGSIFWIENGTKRAFTAYGTYASHGGTGLNTVNVTSAFANQVSSGSNMPN